LPIDAAVATPAEGKEMQTVKYVHWQEGDAWLGYLQDYPDYWTQGETLDDLLDHLRDLYLDLAGGHVGRSKGSDVSWSDMAASTIGIAIRRPA
jgi:hypothetical protein